MHRLGEHCYVWDTAAEIEFVAPARENVYADFVLDAATVDELVAEATDGSKVLRGFAVELVELKTAAGAVVARVRKQIYVRLKPHRRPQDR